MPSLSPLGSRCRHATIALILVLCTATMPSRSSAQYMYLDSNGDGVNTAADVVNPTGTTTIDVYLFTDQSKDGLEALCSYDGSALEIFSYSVSLRAVGGTVLWGAPINRMLEFGVNFGTKVSSTELFFGKGAGSGLPPGRYRLMTVVATVVAGAPEVQIVPTAQSLTGFTNTMFGSYCPGLQGDNTLRLGQDWFDVAGLPLGSPGPANSAPTLASIQDMTAPSGERSIQTVTATDPDDQILSISTGEGPAFMTLTTLSEERGTAAARIYLDPLQADVGPSVGIVQVSDGETTSSRSFGITVTAGPDHPTKLAAIGTLAVTCGRVLTEPITARDPDGEALSFSKIAGPSFLSVMTLAGGPVVTHGSLHLTPSICDAGAHDALIAAGSGPLSAQSPIRINAELPLAISSDLQRGIPAASPVDITLADFNRDGNIDIASASRVPGFSTVVFGDGNGNFGTRFDIPQTGKAFRIISGDWNQDGAPDVGTLDYVGAQLSIYFGRGDGTFVPGNALATGELAQDCLTADLNSDGLLDIVVASSSGSFVSVYMGNGGGTFAPRTDVPTPASALSVAVADLNRDGRLDLAVGMLGPKSISIHFGNGDGTFRAGTEKAVAVNAYTISVGDLNQDGASDLAVTDLEGAVLAILGDGLGGLNPGTPITPAEGFGTSPAGALSDLNGDGYLDMAVVGQDQSGVTALFGDGTGRFPVREQLPMAGSQRVALADVNGDAIPDFVLPGLVRLNDIGAGTAAEARAFLKDPNRTRPGSGGNNPFCVLVEPVNGSYATADLDYPSLSLTSEGTGSVSSISAAPVNAIPEGDTDGNGVADIAACFAGADVARLFDRVSGRRTVHVSLEGGLKDGRRFCSGFDMTVVGTGASGPLAARVTPNPLNPSGVLSFRTSRDGYVRVRLFDLTGRLVRVLADRPLVTSGDQEVRIDGRGARGETLATGAYFYVVETPEGKTRGRIMILK